MSIQGFLNVPDIPGESVRHGHEGEIEVHGVTFAMQASHDPASGRKGRATLDKIVFTKYYDVSSPYLKKVLFESTRLAEVVFSALRTTDGEASDYQLRPHARSRVQRSHHQVSRLRRRVRLPFQNRW